MKQTRMFADIRRFMALADVQLGALLLPGPGAAAPVVLSPHATAVCVCRNSLLPARSAWLSQQRLSAAAGGAAAAERVCRERAGRSCRHVAIRLGHQQGARARAQRELYLCCPSAYRAPCLLSLIPVAAQAPTATPLTRSRTVWTLLIPTTGSMPSPTPSRMRTL